MSLHEIDIKACPAQWTVWSHKSCLSRSVACRIVTLAAAAQEDEWPTVHLLFTAHKYGQNQPYTACIVGCSSFCFLVMFLWTGDQLLCSRYRIEAEMMISNTILRLYLFHLLLRDVSPSNYDPMVVCCVLSAPPRPEQRQGTQRHADQCRKHGGPSFRVRVNDFSRHNYNIQPIAMSSSTDLSTYNNKFNDSVCKNYESSTPQHLISL
ncbi:hypothetical protein JOB18_038991 [Solea senegalensis]|uniref:Uncharacterized protein n=1 Tax=Solea senegalensis TaxID=28829 RepID=A0AAV6Q1X5_SOLSE|nr:hypothetical protein JOB18_038991 [Solea senegalensis]